MRTIILKVVAHGDDLLKIVWGEGNSPLCHNPYFVYRNQLEDSVQKCRGALDEFVSAYLERNPARYASILRNIASLGSEIYFLLFRGARGVENSAIVEDWLASIDEPVRLIVSSDATLHVPWGLVFGGDENSIPNGSAAMSDYGSFWAVKYQLTILYSGMAIKALQKPRERQSFKILSILNRDAFQAGQKFLCAGEQATLARFLETPQGSADSLLECRTKWTQMLENDCLLYVFAHATGTEIQLSNGERISVVDLRRKFLDPRRRMRIRVPECLIILNGCDTAVGALDNSFLTATAEAGCCGFVGTEAPVPTEFAIRFGIALLYMLIEMGKTAIEAVDQLRRQHWPLGLLYGCYSHPDFRIEPNPNPNPLPFPPNSNFSQNSGSPQ